MIKISSRFEIHRDAYGWTLVDWRDGTGKKGQAIRTKRESYYANLTQACDEILDRSAGDCSSVAAILEAIYNARARIVEAIGSRP